MAKEATILLVAGLISVSAPRLAGAQHTHDEQTATGDRREATIVLHVVNHAGLSRHVLTKAEDRVANVYEAIGVHTVWVDSQRPVTKHRNAGLHLTVLLLSLDMARQKIAAEGIADGVLGQALLLNGRAYIFCDRITTMAQTFFAIRLGDVIAHEVGHLMLQANSHSQNGIMRAAMDLRVIQPQGFDKRQARIIRTALMEVTPGAPASPSTFPLRSTPFWSRTGMTLSSSEESDGEACEDFVGGGTDFSICRSARRTAHFP